MSARKVRDIEADIDAALRRCNLRAAGLWCKMRYQIENLSDGRPGELRQNGTALDVGQIAIIAGCPAAKVSPLTDKLLKVGLLARSGPGVIYSPQLARIDELRSQQRARVQRFRVQKHGSDTNRALRNAHKGVTNAECNAPVTTQGVSPPLSLSPTPPISISTPSPIPFSTKTAGKSATSRGGDREKPPGKFPQGVWQRATDGWFKAYEHVHGVKFLEDSREMKALSKILEQLDGELEEFKKVVLAWLREPEVGHAKGHMPHALQADLNFIRGKIAKGTVGHGNANNGRKPTIGTLDEKLAL